MMIAWTLNVVSKKNSVFAQQPNAALSGKVIWVQNSVWKGETRILKFCFPYSESLPFSCVYISRGSQEIVHDLEKSKIQSRIWESPQHVPILTHAYPEYISHSNIYFTIMVSSIPRSFKWSAYSDSATKTLYLLFFSLSLSHACCMSPPPLIHFDLFIIIVLEDFHLKELPSERQHENKSGRLLLFTWLSYLLSRFLVLFTL